MSATLEKVKRVVSQAASTASPAVAAAIPQGVSIPRSKAKPLAVCTGLWLAFSAILVKDAFIIFRGAPDVLLFVLALALPIGASYYAVKAFVIVKRGIFDERQKKSEEDATWQADGPQGEPFPGLEVTPSGYPKKFSGVMKEPSSRELQQARLARKRSLPGMRRKGPWRPFGV